MIIDCISDLHGHYPKLDGGDLLIVAGDLTARDTEEEYFKFFDFLKEQNYERIIVIGGNHDNVLLDGYTSGFALDSCEHIEYLCDSGTEFEGLKIWGSPWTRNFVGMNPHCKAFGLDTDEELAEKWALIPRDVDILITHSPPIGVLDRTSQNQYVGSVSLSAEIGFLNNLKLHVFGHIHEGYGVIEPPAYLPNYFDGCKHYSVNASHVNERYQPINPPIRITL